MWESVTGFFKAAKEYLFTGSEKRKYDQRESSFEGPPLKKSRYFPMNENRQHLSASAPRQNFLSPMKKVEIRETAVTLTSTPASSFAGRTSLKSPKSSPIVYDISDDEDDDDDDEPVPRPSLSQRPKVPEVIDLEAPDYREKELPRRTPVLRIKSPASFVGRYSQNYSQKNGLRDILYQSPSPSVAWPFRKQPTTSTFSVEREFENARTDLNDLFPSPTSAVNAKPVVSRKVSGASTSAAVSVDETENSCSSPSASGSPVSDLKASASLERLNGISGSRSPLAELNEKFRLWDPTRLRSKLARSVDARARRNEMIEKLATEAKLRREARLALQKSVEDEVRIRMRLEGLLIEEKELPEEVEFVELTDDEIALVRKAVGPGRDGDVMVKAFNTEITRKDLKTLVGSNWLNDEVVNFFFNLLMERGGKDGLPKVYTTNTFFYPKVMQGGQASVKRWTRKTDIFTYDMMLVPVHLGNHWCLAVVDFRKEAIQYFDSLGGYNEECLQALAQYLEDEHMEKKNAPLDTSGWDLMTLTDIPHQKNGSDCGVFACRFAEYVSRDAPITFTQEHMPYFRIRTIYEIVTKHLL